VGMVLFQTLCSFGSIWAVFFFATSLGGRTAGVFASFLLAASYDIVRFNFFILTDSLYISFAIFTVAIFFKAYTRSARWYLLGIPCLVVTVLLRPNGWIFLPAFVVFGTLNWRLAWKFKSLIIAGFLTLALAVVFLSPISDAIQKEKPIKKLIVGEVVWGYDKWRVAMPEFSHDISATAGWTNALSYIVDHPLACVKLALIRVAAAFAHVRPFYSNFHNLLALLFLLPFYSLAIRGWYLTRKEPLALLMASVILGHVLTIALTFADWDGRFLLYFFPFIIVFAGRGFEELLLKINMHDFEKKNAA